MYLSTTAQNDTAALIAKWIRENTNGYVAVAAEVGWAGYPGAATVSIVEYGKITSTAKVAIHHNRLVYVSKIGAHISYPIALEDAGRIVGGFLSLEEG